MRLLYVRVQFRLPRARRDTINGLNMIYLIEKQVDGVLTSTWFKGYKDKQNKMVRFQ